MIKRWLVTTVVIFVASYLFPGIKVESFFSALVAALCLGIVSVLIGWLLLAITLPINVMTLGLFSFVIYAVLVMIASKMSSGFEVVNFWWALLLGFIIYVANKII